MLYLYLMKDFLSIGKVAKLKNVSIKSLRYYDEIGILKPALTDHTTGYRYYKEAQLYVLDAISLCIELGIPLKELKKYASSDGSYDLQRLLGDAKDLAENRIRSRLRMTAGFSLPLFSSRVTAVSASDSP